MKTDILPHFFSAGFRPFFLGAAVWAIVAVSLWVLYFAGIISPELYLDPLAWHIHELVYGYAAAAIAGFALTAIPNWTGRTPMHGWPLLLLFVCWLLARLTSLEALATGTTALVNAILNIAFLTGFSTFAAKEIVAGGNKRNYVVILLFSLFTLTGVASTLFQNEFIGSPLHPGYGGILVIIPMIMLIGGRIIPNFTNNWLRNNGMTPTAKTFGKLDGVTVFVTLAAIFLYHSPIKAEACILAGIMNIVRLSRWAGHKTVRDPIVIVLHVSYLWIAIGFICLGLSTMGYISESAAIHAWTAGAIGGMTLAVMSRAALGHSGRKIESTGPLTLLYICVHAAAAVRLVSGATFVSDPMPFILASAALWTLAFALFAGYFLPVFFAGPGDNK